jgi:hypothetical protein
MIRKHCFQYGILALVIMSLALSVGFAKPKDKGTVGASGKGHKVKAQKEEAPGSPFSQSTQVSKDTTQKSKGRGNPHEEGMKGDPHQEGIKGDPHQQPPPGKAVGKQSKDTTKTMTDSSQFIKPGDKQPAGGPGTKPTPQTGTSNDKKFHTPKK